MKPEHFKEFNVEHAQAGAPYCQRNGLEARVRIWDGNHKVYPLMGAKTCASGTEIPSSWSIEGKFHNSEMMHVDDLVMLPLGYCQEKPVFVGDELINGGGRAFTVEAKTQIFPSHRWPRTAPGGAGFKDGRF